MDRAILRALAAQIAEIAHLDIQRSNRDLHRAVNSLRMIRPVVLLDELPWNQLNTDGELTLQCEDEYLRTVERELRRTLYRWNHCAADMIVEPYYRLHRAIGIGDIGFTVDEDVLAADGDNHIVSHHYRDQMPDEEALEKMHAPEITVDDALTERRREQLDAIFGDLLEVRVTGLTNAGFYMPWDNLSMWRGVEPIYTDLYDQPELLHRFMQRFLAIHLDLLDRLERMNLLDANMGTLHCTPGLVDELPGEIIDRRVTRRNMWGRGNAQVFASVSPAMHDEFEIEYAKEFFKGFGLVYYGCCEPLQGKIDIVKKIPNLRKISVTPWADVRKSAERIGKDYVMSRKPNPAFVAVSHLEEDALRKEIIETLAVCREHGTPVEFTLKDISSVGYHPNNLTRWAQIAMESVCNF